MNTLLRVRPNACLWWRSLAKTQLPTTWNTELTGQSVLNLGCRQLALTVPHQLCNAPLRARHLHRHLLTTQHGASVTAGHKAELSALHITAETDGAILRESDKLKHTKRMGRPPSLRGESAGRPGVLRGRPRSSGTFLQHLGYCFSKLFYESDKLKPTKRWVVHRHCEGNPRVVQGSSEVVRHSLQHLGHFFNKR